MLVLPDDFANLRFTEIHYHPAAEDTIENRAYEFLELKNIGRSPIDLSEWQFVQGIKFKFPMRSILHGGDFIVLASHPQKFRERYGIRPFGSYEGFLANNGEKMTLVSASAETTNTMAYDDRLPWPESADGHGYSLVPTVLNPDADQNDPSHWRASLAIHGSPGRDDQPNTLVSDGREKAPNDIKLEQNYPNPFNPTTTISYDIPNRVFVTLTVYDILGREIKTLVSRHHEANRFSVSFDANGLSSGVYFYRIKAGAEFMETKKMLLVR
jgi:hypothetical protein